jgi:hypothetical protein
MLHHLVALLVLHAPSNAGVADASTMPVAWGANGHRIVAAIAERHLLPVTRMRIAELLGPAPLARWGEWADKYRATDEGRHTAPWHYVNVPDGERYEPATFEEPRDIIQALEQQESILADRSRPTAERARALKLLIHFVADVHQPLHVGRADDRGGNDVDVRWFGMSTNLHTLWDTHLLEHHRLSYTEYTAFLDFASPADVAAWLHSDYVDWAHESMAVRDSVYTLPAARGDDVPDLRWDYADAMTPIMERRLVQAGIRLAGVLNRVLGEEAEGR